MHFFRFATSGSAGFLQLSTIVSAMRYFLDVFSMVLTKRVIPVVKDVFEVPGDLLTQCLRTQWRRQTAGKSRVGEGEGEGASKP